MFQGIGVALVPICISGLAALWVIHVNAGSPFGVCWRVSEDRDQWH